VPKKSLPILIAVFFTLTFSSCTCIYFNTFHNIRKNFNAAEDTRKKDGRDQARSGEVKQYTDAIAKASKVLERHPTSSWVDDALFIIGASYYYLGDFDKASRKFKELFANYPNSEYVPRSRLLMAKAKLQLKEEAEAVVLFEEIFEKEQDKSMKADAARALGEYYFETKDYASANNYFTSLTDSLGDENDKLRARLFVADGYYERYRFDKALENYNKGLDHSPDTLQYYRIMFRMAECDYFLNNISGGLEKLEKLAGDETYYDSLTPIRLKMAEGYEWDGDYTDAINVYDKVIVENPGSDAAAVAYYSLGLIYQYDFEELEKARGYYQKSLEEKRNSSVSEEATRRASKLALMEQYARTGEIDIEADSSGVLDQARLDKLTETQYLLGELFYFDLGKPDSALHAFQQVLERYPQSRYAPKALMSMAYIQRAEYADTAAAESLLRQVLTGYARYDEAEVVIGMLGLAGTTADTGYAAIVFSRAEKFLEQYQELDSSVYFLSLVADSILAADSLRRLDSTQVSDSGMIPDMSQMFDSMLTEAMVALEDTLPAIIDSTAFLDSLRRADAVRAADSLANARRQQRADSIRVADSMRYVEARRVADSIQNAYRRRVIDSAMAADSRRAADSAKAAEPKPATDSAAGDSALAAFTGVRPDTSAAKDSTPDFKPQIPAGDSTPASDTATTAVSIPESDSLKAEVEPQPEDTVEAVSLAEAPPPPSGDTIAPPVLGMTDDSLPPADSGKTGDSSAISETTKAVDSLQKADALRPVDQSVTPDTTLVVDTPEKADSLRPMDQSITPDTTLVVDSLPKPDAPQTGYARPKRDSTTAASLPKQDSLAAAAAAEPEPEPEEPQIDYWRVAFDSARSTIDPKMYSLLDSAQYLYHQVIDSFPFSDYSIQARYVLLWIYDKYLTPGDSSLIGLYKSFVDSFPTTEYAQLISDRYGIRAAGAPARRRTDNQQQQQQQDEPQADTGLYAGQELTADERADSILLASPESKFITDEEGNILEPADKYFLREEVQFKYPMEALAYNIEDKLYFHIRIDFSGEVVELKLLNETASSELNDRIKETVKNSKFDASKIPPELYDHWFYYTYKVQIPPELRQR